MWADGSFQATKKAKPTGCIWRCFTQQKDKKGQGHYICILLLHIWPKCNHEKAFLHELWPVSASDRVFNQGTWFYDYRPDVERLATNRKKQCVCNPLHAQALWTNTILQVVAAWRSVFMFVECLPQVITLLSSTPTLSFWWSSELLWFHTVFSTFWPPTSSPPAVNSPHTYTPALLSVLSAGLLPVSSAVSQSVPAL